MSRGNAKQKIFLSTYDRLDFLGALAEVVACFSWVCHAYCLMDNHYHLLIQTPHANLSKGMHNLNSTYCQGFNRKHERVGHVMQGRFKSPFVKNDDHLRELTRYMAMNPVRGGLVREPEQWRWSNYRAAIGLVPVPGFLEVKYTLGLFDEDTRVAQEAYIRFVAEGLLAERSTNQMGRITLRELFRGAEDKYLRKQVIRSAHLEHGYTMTEIAAYLKLNRSTVSRAIRK